MASMALVAQTLQHCHDPFEDGLDPARDAIMPPRRRRRLTGARIAFAGGASLALAMLVALLHAGVDEDGMGPAPGPTDPLAWVDVARPDRLFAFSAPDLDRLAAAYEVRRQPAGDGREDLLTFGTPENPTPYTRLVVQRGSRRDGAEVPLFVELARRAAEAGLAIARAGQPQQVATRFGPFEAAEVSVAAAAGSRPCLGFAFVSADPDIRIAGLSCGRGSALPVSGLSCLIDGLELVASDDHRLEDFFADAERRRDGACPHPRRNLVPVTRSEAEPPSASLDPKRGGARKRPAPADVVL
ncbi:MAG: hypothetical protein JO366_18360 [Methylobacteriaceae bacterium]|nr:hypothetical protein [Methylobacteriaceae bacterium]